MTKPHITDNQPTSDHFRLSPKTLPTEHNMNFEGTKILAVIKQQQILIIRDAVDVVKQKDIWNIHDGPLRLLMKGKLGNVTHTRVRARTLAYTMEGIRHEYAWPTIRTLTQSDGALVANQWERVRPWPQNLHAEDNFRQVRTIHDSWLEN